MRCETWCVNFTFAGYLEVDGIKPDKNDALRAFACVIDYIFFFDENITVNGVVPVGDMGRYTLKMETYVTMEERRDFMQTWQVRSDMWHTLELVVTTCSNLYMTQEMTAKI